MFEIFKKKDEIAKTVTTYSIDEVGLKNLSEAVKNYGDAWDYNKLHIFYADINYLDGVCCTLEDRERFNDIIIRMASLKHILECNVITSTENIPIE